MDSNVSGMWYPECRTVVREFVTAIPGCSIYCRIKSAYFRYRGLLKMEFRIKLSLCFLELTQ